MICLSIQKCLCDYATADPYVFVQIVMFALTLIFAIVHSGLASLRDQGERLIGERAFRVLFAGISLPLAVSTVVSSLPLIDHLLGLTNRIFAIAAMHL